MAAPQVEVDIASYLTGTVGLSNVSISLLAPTPLNQYAIVEYAGPMGIKVHGASNPNANVLDESHIQIMARHTSAASARTNIYAVYDSLDGLKDVTLNSKVYTYITAISRPRLLTREESGAIIFIAEFWIQSRRP